MSSKRKQLIIDILIILIFTCLGFYSYIKGSIDVGDDLTFHLNRFVGLSNAIEERQILPKIYPYANNEYGYASPLFYCDLFLYPFAILYHFGLSAVWCYKLCVFFYTLIGNVIVYIILNKETNNRQMSLIGSFIYFTANYHLINIFVRNALGEILSISVIPLVLYSIYKILVKHEPSWVYLGVSFSLLVMSHLLTTLLYGLFFLCMIIVFIIINFKDKKLIIDTLLAIIKGTILAVLLTCWYLLPMIEQLSSQTFWLNVNPSYNFINSTTSNISEILSVFITPLNGGMEECYSVGLPIIIVGLFALIKGNKYINISIAYCIFLYLIILGVINGGSLNVIQFYFRLYTIIFPLFVICTVYVLNILNNKKMMQVISACLIIFGTINIYLANTNIINSKHTLSNYATVYEINHVEADNYDLDYNHDELGGAEYLPYSDWTNYIDSKKSIDKLDDNGIYVEYTWDYSRNYSELSFEVNNSKDESYMLPISYYKGYEAYEYIDGDWAEISLDYSKKYKLLVLNTNVGNHIYKVKYVGTTVQYISLAISTFSLLGLVILKIKKSLENKEL